MLARPIQLLLLTCSLFTTSLQSEIFLVHGSFARKSSWYQPGGHFYEQLSSEARKENKQVIPVSWSGSVLARGIIKASHDLAQQIIDTPGAEHTLIGHSNGGNVIAYMTSLLEHAIREHKLTKESLFKRGLDTLPTSLTKPFGCTPDSQEYQEIAHALSSLKESYQSRLKKSPQSSYLLDRIYLLGTPIDYHRFAVNMNVTRQLFNLYSEADLIQKVAGDVLVPVHERAVNISLKLYDSKEQKLIEPSHNNLHNTLVATWLLSLPKIAEEVDAMGAPDSHSLEDLIAQEDTKATREESSALINQTGAIKHDRSTLCLHKDRRPIYVPEITE